MITSAVRLAFTISPKVSALSPASSILWPSSLISSPASFAPFSALPNASSFSFSAFDRSSVSLSVSSVFSAISSSAFVFASNARFISFNCTCALFNWICQFCDCVEPSPYSVFAASSADFKSSILFFCVSIWRANTSFVSVSAWADLLLSANWLATSFISLRKTDCSLAISFIACLYSRSPSSAIFAPIFAFASAISAP